MFNALRNNLTYLFPKNPPFLSKSYSYVYFSTSCNDKQNPINPSSVSEYLLRKHHFSPAVASHVASIVTILRDRENSDSLLYFLKDAGFTKSQLEKTLKSRPRLLLTSLENVIKPKIKILQDYGFSDTDIAYIISTNAAILHTSAQNRVIPNLSLLKDFLSSNASVAKDVRKSGWLLQVDLEKTMMPNINFLNSCGVAMEQISMLLNYLPRFLLYKPEIVWKCVEKVSEMGVDKSSRMFIYAVAVVGSMRNGNWDTKLQTFRNVLEFSEDDILRVLKRNPQVFTVSEDKMKRVKEVLLATGKYKASCIVKFPKSVLYSIEKRFKPRFRVLEILESRGLIKKWPRLQSICRMSDDKFFKQFVCPYEGELGEDYMHRIMIK